ncbi:MAG: glycosyltransferase [Desulfobacterales bacterium]
MMNISLFYHSLVSDWNNGNAHFLRGIVTELVSLGHRVTVYEPADGWSFQNLKQEVRTDPIPEFCRNYPLLRKAIYRYPVDFDPAPVLESSDLVIVHEWNTPDLVRRIARHRKSATSYKLLFHDTHHRAFSQARSLEAFLLDYFDGVLAYGESIRQIYLDKGWNRRVWTWHEAADTRVFRPLPDREKNGDVVWIGNWGDEERTAEYEEFLLHPVRSLNLKACAYGVRYPDKGRELLEKAGVAYHGWLANYRVPEIYARFSATLHIPRGPYTRHLRGIPTIRPFEALACGIPLISTPWDDAEGLFTPERDYMTARTGREMKDILFMLLEDEDFQRSLGESGRRTIMERHTCFHRVRELMSICGKIGIDPEKRVSFN